MSELLPGEASEPVEGQGEDALPGLRLRSKRPGPVIALLLAASSGALLSLSLPPVDVGWLAFLAPIPFLWIVRDARPARGLLLGLAFGIAYFGLVLYWILLFGELGWTALVLVSACFTGIFGLLTPVLWRERHPVVSVIGLASLWTVLEAVRGAWPLGGFAWGQLGSTQTGDPTLLRLASMTGVWGPSFVVILVAGLLLVALEGWSRSRARAIALAGACVVLVLAPGILPPPGADGPVIDVAAIQVDVREAEHLSRDAEDIAVARMNIALHSALADDPPDLVVWGEGSLDPGASSDETTMGEVRSAVASVGAPTLAGAVLDDPDGNQHTSVLLFDGTGVTVHRYDKVVLVPFGEYVPFRERLEWIDAIDQIPVDRVPGEEPHTVTTTGLPPFGTPICYENSFPRIEREMARRGAAFFVLTTNNASYGMTAASRQHVLMSRLRAVETGRWVVHAAVSGISAVIDPRGDVVVETDLFEPGVMRTLIRASDVRTIYVRFGDWFVWLSLVAVLALFAVPRSRRRAVRPAGALPDAPRTLVVLPTYNERVTIGDVLGGLLTLDGSLDMVVIDDGSPDGTREVVSERASTEPRIRLIERDRKAGLASAYLDGFRLGIEERYDLIVEMDSDLSHLPEQLPSLLEAARSHHMVIGSRYVPGGSVTNWSRARLGLSRAGNLYARVCLGFPLRDATSGFRVYRRPLLERLVARPFRSDGYGFQVELAYRAWSEGYDVGEVPITFREREHGHSKISRRIVAEAFWLVAVWGLGARLRPS